MALKIALEPVAPIIGYRNLSINGQNPLCEKANWTDLSAIGITDNSVNEIRAQHLVGKMHYSQIANFLRQWHSKLEVGGLLYLEGLEAISVGNKIARNAWNVQELNDTVFGRPPAINISMYSLFEIKDALQQTGFAIESAGINDVVFYINARKL